MTEFESLIKQIKIRKELYTGKRVHYPKILRKRIVKFVEQVMKKEKLTQKAVALKLGLIPQTVNHWVKQYGETALLFRDANTGEEVDIDTPIPVTLANGYTLGLDNYAVEHRMLSDENVAPDPLEEVREQIEEVLLSFQGEQEQMPPLFSAKSVDGKRAYAMARQGKTVELKKHKIHISRLELSEVRLPDLTLEVDCSKGTYIRSLARDLGERLDSGAHLTGLRRTRIGPYGIEKAISLENFENNLKLL